MSGGWAGSTARTRTSSATWKRTRLRILDRDARACRLHLEGCTVVANEVDHIVSPLDGGGDDDANLRAACTDCHRKRSSRQGNAARPRQRRAPEAHPGLLP